MLENLTILARQAATNPADWVSIAKDGGAVGVLIIGIYLFLTGKLVSAKTAREQTAAAVKAAQVAANAELGEKLQKAVREGFIQGWYEIHTSHQEAIAEVEAKASAIKEPKTGARRK